MEIVIFIFYLILFSFFISSISFFKASKIGTWTLIILFLIKIVAGVGYAKFYSLPKYYAGADTWRFYRLSLAETKWLLQDPKAFLKDLFIDNYGKSGNIFSSENSYWNDLKSNVIVKLLAVINVFTNNSYYANIIFFNFLFLFGLAALFRVLYHIFPGKKWIIIIGIFLLPSPLFWCSGIHKDGLILSAVGIIIYTFYQGIKDHFTINRIVVLLLCFLAVFSLRNYVLFALFPALLSWWLCEKYPGKNLRTFAVVYISGIVFLLLIAFVSPSVNFLAFIANKQHEFLLLEGGSKVSVPQLQPAVTSFVSFIPNALDMAFIRPHLNEIKNLINIPSFVENVVLLLILLISMIFFNKKLQSEPLLLVLFFFPLSIMLLAGYTIPFTGAIVRYKSLVLPLFITPLICLVNVFPFLKKTKNKI